jgi:hypothetical protein
MPQGGGMSLGGARGIAGFPVNVYDKPQLDARLFNPVTLGHLTAGPGPALALLCAKRLLEQGQAGSACEILQKALQQYPTDERLLNLYQAISPGKVVRRDVRYSNRALEIAWIKANHSRYRGKWVALLGEHVLAVGDSLKAVLRLVQEQQPEDTPFIHHFD